MATEVMELVTEDPGPDHGLHPQEARPHLRVLPPPVVGTERLLDLDGGRPHLEEASAVIPAADAALEDEDLPGEHAVPLLLQEEVVGVLEEDLGPAELVVCLDEDRLADLLRGLSAVHLVGRRTAVDQVSVSLHELLEGVSDGVARPPDPDGLHHPRVSQLAAAQLPVEHLQVLMSRLK